MCSFFLESLSLSTELAFRMDLGLVTVRHNSESQCVFFFSVLKVNKRKFEGNVEAIEENAVSRFLTVRLMCFRYVYVLLYMYDRNKYFFSKQSSKGFPLSLDKALKFHITHTRVHKIQYGTRMTVNETPLVATRIRSCGIFVSLHVKRTRDHIFKILFVSVCVPPVVQKFAAYSTINTVWLWYFLSILRFFFNR